MTKDKLAQILTFSGILPFAFAALTPLWNPDFLGLEYARILLAYSAVIASFIAGIHWGIYLLKELRLNLFIHSNIAALCAWLALLLHAPFGIMLLSVCFSYLLWVDYKVFEAGLTERWYIRMRLMATLSVVTLLLFSLIIS